MMYAPRGIGAAGAVLALEYCIVCMLEPDRIAVLPFLIAPVMIGIVYHFRGTRLFLKPAKGDADKAGQYADAADKIVFVLAIIAVAVFYNLGFLPR